MTAPVPPGLPPQPFGPDEHNAVQKAMGLPMVGKLYVLSKGDPFYCGTRAQARPGVSTTVVYETPQPCLDAVHRPADQSDEMRRWHDRVLGHASRARSPRCRYGNV